MFQTNTSHKQMQKCNKMSLSDFGTGPRELEALASFELESFDYLLEKIAINNQLNPISKTVVINFQDYLDLTTATHTERSEVGYVEVMDAGADRKDTMLDLIHNLHTKFIAGKSRDYLVIEGDQKLYGVLQELKCEYGNDLDWVIPMPGDWHLLMNFQKAIIKPYFDAGLKELAKAAGYPTASIQVCGQFKRTHQFLLEVWEALSESAVALSI